MIKELAWDSSFFNMAIGELTIKDRITTDNKDDFGLIYVKSTHKQNLILQGFEKTFEETKIVFVKAPEKSVPDPDVRSATAQDAIDALYLLAYESGNYSRFNLDRRFGQDNFKKLYRAWVDNSFRKQFADDILVYCKDTAIAGFVTYKISGDAATVGLIAVSPELQGMGIGKKLLRCVENRIAGNVAVLKIPTQLENKSAYSFYKSMGFEIQETTHIMHYWKI